MYGKIFESMYDGTLAEDWTVRVVFMDMIILADRDGHVDVTPEALSRRTNVPIDIINNAIKRLESPDPSSRSHEHDGSRIERLDEHRDWGWRIVNYMKYRNKQAEEQKREKDRERQRRHREKERCHGLSRKSRHTDTDTDTDTDINRERPKKRATQVAEDFLPDKVLIEWAEKEGFTEEDIYRETPRMIDHFRGEGKAKKDWRATWRNWMRRSREWSKRNGKSGTRTEKDKLDASFEAIDNFGKERNLPKRDEGSGLNSA